MVKDYEVQVGTTVKFTHRYVRLVNGQILWPSGEYRGYHTQVPLGLKTYGSHPDTTMTVTKLPPYEGSSDAGPFYLEPDLRPMPVRWLRIQVITGSDEPLVGRFLWETKRYEGFSKFKSSGGRAIWTPQNALLLTEVAIMKDGPGRPTVCIVDYRDMELA